jgi:hypothetical protein
MLKDGKRMRKTTERTNEITTSSWSWNDHRFLMQQEITCSSLARANSGTKRLFGFGEDRGANLSARRAGGPANRDEVSYQQPMISSHPPLSLSI